MPSSAEIRESFAERLRDEGLSDLRLKSLQRWVARLPDAEVEQAVELVTIGLDSPRLGRANVFWLLDVRVRDLREDLPHEVACDLLRWIVRARVSHGSMTAKLDELLGARSDDERTELALALREAGSTSLANAHSIFAHAWRAAPADARPHEVHRGEVEPVIGVRGAIRATIFTARSIEHLLPPKGKKPFAKLLALAEKAAQTGIVTPELRNAAITKTADPVVLVARSACAEARTNLRKPDHAGASARPAAVKAVQLLLQLDGKDAVRSFLEGLDAELRRLDILHALFQREKRPTVAITAPIYRGSDPKGKLVLWLALLEGGTLGLLAKQGRYWVWSEGGRDEILAMIPDAHFERAVMAAKDVVPPRRA